MQRYVPISSKATMTGTRVHSRTVCARSHVCGSKRGAVVVKAGLFDFLFGGPRAKSSPRATELVDELLDIAVRTKGGNLGGSKAVAQVEELINELEEYRGASTLKSPLFWGDYKVVYASKQVALGGPFRTGLGQVIFSDQYAGNRLDKPNRYTNRLLFKTLGLVEGSVTQFAEFTPTGPNTFDLAFFSEEFNVLGKQVKDCDPESNANRRTIEIVYQDDRVQIRRGIVPGRGGAPTLFVLERQGVQQEQRQALPTSQSEGQGTFKLGLKPKAGLATMAERNLRTSTPERTEKVQVPGMKGARAEERAAEAAARQLAKEEAAAVRQAEIEAREAEREAQRKQREEIQEMMQQLQSQAKEAQAEAKKAQDSLRRVQRQNQGVLKNAEEERTRLERLEEELTQVRSDLSSAVDEEKEATVIVRRLNKELKEAEKALR